MAHRLRYAYKCKKLQEEGLFEARYTPTRTRKSMRKEHVDVQSLRPEIQWTTNLVYTSNYEAEVGVLRECSKAS